MIFLPTINNIGIDIPSGLEPFVSCLEIFKIANKTGPIRLILASFPCFPAYTQKMCNEAVLSLALACAARASPKHSEGG
jgi:hypothetical protein